MERIFYQGRYPAILLADAEGVVFFRAAARLLAQCGPISNLLLATDRAGTVMCDAQQKSLFKYSAYGFEPGLSNSKCRVGFNGEVYDRTFQGYLLGGKRAYIPGRPGFNSPDVFNMRGRELNWMGYCSGDPVNYSDPSGRTKQPLTLRKLALDVAKNSKIAGLQAWALNNRRVVSETGGHALLQSMDNALFDKIDADTLHMLPSDFDNYFEMHPERAVYKKYLATFNAESIAIASGPNFALDQVVFQSNTGGQRGIRAVPLGMNVELSERLGKLLEPHAVKMAAFQRAVHGGLEPVFNAEVFSSFKRSMRDKNLYAFAVDVASLRKGHRKDLNEATALQLLN